MCTALQFAPPVLCGTKAGLCADDFVEVGGIAESAGERDGLEAEGRVFQQIQRPLGLNFADVLLGPAPELFLEETRQLVARDAHPRSEALHGKFFAGTITDHSQGNLKVRMQMLHRLQGRPWFRKLKKKIPEADAGPLPLAAAEEADQLIALIPERRGNSFRGPHHGAEEAFRLRRAFEVDVVMCRMRWKSPHSIPVAA